MRESPQSTRSSRSPLPITGTRCWPSPHRRASTTGPCSGTGWSTSIGSRRPIPTGARAGAAPERIIDVIADGSGSFLHAQTFSHHPVACAAGLAAVRHLKGHNLVERCATLGAVLQERLAALRELPHVGDVRGRGLLAGIEFVEDKATRAPLPRTARFAESFTEAAQQTGLVVWPNVGHADGTNGDLVMVAPPFIVTEQEIDEIVRRLAEALDMTLQSRQPSASRTVFGA